MRNKIEGIDLMIGEVLKEARKRKGKNQQEVADKARVSRAYYADVERNRYTPSLKLLSKLGVILDINLNFLKKVDGNTSKNKENRHE